jgi:hypothetical protein
MHLKKLFQLKLSLQIISHNLTVPWKAVTATGLEPGFQSKAIILARSATVSFSRRVIYSLELEVVETYFTQKFGSSSSGLHLYSGSYRVRISDYCYWNCWWISSGKCGISTLNYVTTASFQILSNWTFISSYRSALRSVTADGFVKQTTGIILFSSVLTFSCTPSLAKILSEYSEQCQAKIMFWVYTFLLRSECCVVCGRSLCRHFDFEQEKNGKLESAREM